MNLFIPKEIVEFFGRAKRSLDGIDAAVNDLQHLVSNVNAEVTEWRKLRERLQAALSMKAE
jgi:hypothetical protein